jgi:secondary thiamine-phosphate synthase enzyme
MEEISVKTCSKIEMIDITRQVQDIVQHSTIKHGICIVFVPHTTAAITINENADPSVLKDIIGELNKIIPLQDNYRHMEGNSAAHIKTTLTGCSQMVIIENGELQLGTWQSFFFCEFDGPRNRKVWVKIIKGQEVKSYKAK